MVVDGLQETLIVAVSLSEGGEGININVWDLDGFIDDGSQAAAVGVPMADVKEVIACMSRIYEQEKGRDQ